MAMGGLKWRGSDWWKHGDKTNAKAVKLIFWSRSDSAGKWEPNGGRRTKRTMHRCCCSLALHDNSCQLDSLFVAGNCVRRIASRKSTCGSEVAIVHIKSSTAAVSNQQRA